MNVYIKGKSQRNRKHYRLKFIFTICLLMRKYTNAWEAGSPGPEIPYPYCNDPLIVYSSSGQQ